MPEHSPIINVRVDTCGDHSWNTAYGAYTVPVPIPYGKCVDLSIVERFIIIHTVVASPVATQGCYQA